MKYPTRIKVNENSKALRCPICDNEEVPLDGDYCPICGADLINRCSNIDSYGNGCGALLQVMLATVYIVVPKQCFL